MFTKTMTVALPVNVDERNHAQVNLSVLDIDVDQDVLLVSR